LKKNADRLRQALADSHALAAGLDDPGFPLLELDLLQSWQRQRLADTYDDLIRQEHYRAAGEFFLGELYGGLHFRERDAQVERVLPVMVRMLRDDMLLALAEAFDLQSLSLSLDIGMTEALVERGWDTLDVTRYGTIYRACGRIEERERQIALIHRLGLELNELVHHRLVLWLVKTVRAPARAAGFGRLQSFLETGLYAFRAMGDGTPFIEAIHDRETRAMQALFAGRENPFKS
jgi:hypothetical protein